jgi:hypothetical protein
MPQAVINANRAHAVQQLKKFMKEEDEVVAERYWNGCVANAAIYIGDSLAALAKALEPQIETNGLGYHDDTTDDDGVKEKE